MAFEILLDLSHHVLIFLVSFHKSDVEESPVARLSCRYPTARLIKSSLWNTRNLRNLCT